MADLIESHKFLDLCYLLDAKGQQIGDGFFHIPGNELGEVADVLLNAGRFQSSHI